MGHPYVELNPHNFWNKAVSLLPSALVDPVTRSFRINDKQKISTMGSCFAQHLAKSISKLGFNYFIPEVPPANLNRIEAVERNYDIFSARYGNVYTVRQAIQLFDRAFSLTEFRENIWSKDINFVDAFRPHIEPNGFVSQSDVLSDRLRHLASVKRVFLESDVLIFTMGLTEAWKSKVDDSIFPVAPGVFGGVYDPSEHEFINFTVLQVIEDLNKFIEKLRSVNSSLKIILTVSPVPLIATFEDRHVLSSTCASKSILRCAADLIERNYKDVYYFPAYEIITLPSSMGKYYENDFREVKSNGVEHVMRVFSKHFLQRRTEFSSLNSNKRVFDLNSKIVCDEELITKALKSAAL